MKTNKRFGLGMVCMIALAVMAILPGMVNAQDWSE